MRSLYESILDDEQSKFDKAVLMSKNYEMRDMDMNAGDYSKVNIAKFLDWRKVQSDVKNLRAQSDWVQYANYNIYNPLVELIMNQPYIGHTQNVVHTLQRYVKSGFTVSYIDSRTTAKGWNITEYQIKKGNSKEDELHIITKIFKNKH